MAPSRSPFGLGVSGVAIVAAGCWLVAYAVGLALIDDPGARVVQSNFVYATPDLVGAVLCGWLVWKHRAGFTRRASLSLRWLGVSCALSFCADMLYAGYYYLDGKNEVFPSWADPIWLASDLALIVAISCAFFRLSLLRRLRGLLDALVAGLGLAAALWVTGVGSTTGQGLASSIVTVAYPVADLVMLVLLLSVGMGSLRRLPLPLTLLGVGCLLLVTTDLISVYTTTFDTYTVGSWLDLGWQASAVFTVLAVLGVARELPPETDMRPLDLIDVNSKREAPLVMDRDVFGLMPLFAGVAGAFFVVVSQATSGELSSAALLLAGATVVVVFIRMLLSVADQRAVSRRLDEALREQKQLAITDMLTELYNRRFIEELLRLEASRAMRDGTRLAVMLLDIDRFKTVNDTYGHQSGDVVLAEVAVRIRRVMRDADVVGRWGGEEFLAVFPGADLAASLEISERIRQALSAQTIRLVDGTRITVTASVGVATLPTSNADVDTLLWQADQALYAAKENGRNRIYAWDASGVSAEPRG